MIVLADRNFAAAALIAAITRTQADVLVRVKNGRKLPVLRRYHDGSALSLLGATQVRVIEAQITIATSAGCRTGIYRLATTLARSPPLPCSRTDQALPRALGCDVRSHDVSGHVVWRFKC